MRKTIVLGMIAAAAWLTGRASTDNAERIRRQLAPAWDSDNDKRRAKVGACRTAGNGELWR